MDCVVSMYDPDAALETDVLGSERNQVTVLTVG